MDWSSDMLGAPPEQVLLVDGEAEADAHAARVSEAKRIMLERAELAVTDENGRHLSERKWRQRHDFIAGL